MKLDSVLLEIMATKLSATAEEMGNALQRSGRTMYVKETQDFGTGLVNHGGKLFAYPHGIGVAGMIDNDCSDTLAAVPDLEPGDVIITNHPYASGGLASHLPDLHLLKPYFHEGRILCYGWCFVHSADVGGRVPSSISPSNKELFQEGLMVPPMKLVIKGQMNKDFMSLFKSNCRTGEENEGDIKAMLAALGVGERRVAAIVAQHGAEVFSSAATDVLEYSFIKARDAFRTIPDGVYEFADYLDDDLVSQIPVRIHARMTIADGLLDLDFSETDPQVAAAFNVPSCGKRHTWLSLRLLQYAFTRDPSIPLNSGIFDPMTITTLHGSLLNPAFPAAVGVRHAAGNRIMDVLNGILAQAVPEFMRAAGCGIVVPIVLAGPENSEGDRQVLVVQLLTGGTGAMNLADGIDGRDPGTSGMANNPIESVESAAPITILRYGVREDSGGAGQWRGGVGLELTFSPRVAGCQILARGMERHRFVPWGFAGGASGFGSQTIKNKGRSDETELGKIDVLDLEPGDTITIFTPGGGGYGDPYQRDPELVLNDVKRDFVSMTAARANYGVVLSENGVDARATASLRQELAKKQAKPAVGALANFDFGTERRAWETEFSDRLMTRIHMVLAKLNPTARMAARKRLFAPVNEALKMTSIIDATALSHAADLMRSLLSDLEGVPKPSLPDR
jgi:N-methylhydantoinase B